MSFLGCVKARIGTAAESEVSIERQYSHGWKAFREHCRAAVRRSVVDDNDFVVRMADQRVDDGRKITFQQIAPIPVGDYDGG